MNYIQWLDRLVAHDTTSSRSNLELITDVKDWLNDRGISSHVILDQHEPKANLLATIPAADGGVQGGVLFSGHTDVVPVIGQKWETDPFKLTQVGDKLYGRGTCDMKGFIAVVLSLVPEWQQQKLSAPIHLAFSYDEEVGCRGAPLIVAKLKDLGIQPDACIVGEPTSMVPIIAHKGIQVFRCSVHGLSAHSSLTPQGCNAIDYAAQMICYIRQLALELQHARVDKDFDVPFTTISTNMIQGGSAQNIIPNLCEFIFEFRNLPTIEPHTITEKLFCYVQDKLLPVMRKEYKEAQVDLDQLAVAPSFSTDENTLVKLLREITSEQAIRKVAYATEAGIFQRGEVPTVVCGPGSIEQAHRSNEYVEVAQLAKCEQVLRALVKM